MKQQTQLDNKTASNFENFGTTKGNSKALRGNIDSYKKLRKGGMGMSRRSEKSWR